MSEMLLHRLKRSPLIPLILGGGIIALAGLHGQAKEVGSSAPAPSGQVAGSVEDEISRRLANMKQATGLIQEGDAAMADKDYGTAVEKFRQAVTDWELQRYFEII